MFVQNLFYLVDVLVNIHLLDNHVYSHHVLQLQLLQRQSLLLLLPIIIRGVFSRIEILLGLVVLLVVVGVVALGLLLHIVQNNDSGATRRIQRLDYLQALRFIVV